MKQILILLADDHNVMRRGLRLLLESQPDFKVVAEAADEASVSRIYAGQHFRTDQVAGQRLGRRIADYVLQNFLTANAPGYR